MGAYFDKKKGWRFSFFYHGDRHQSPRAFETKRDALDAEAVLRRQLTRQQYGLEPDPVARPAAPRFAEWAGVYWTFVEEQHRHGLVKRPDVIQGNLRVVLRFFGAPPEEPHPDDFAPDYETPYHDLRLDDPIEDPTWIRKFEDWLTTRKVSGSTRNHYLNTLSRLYWLAQHPEYRQLAPGVGTNPFSYRPRTRWQRRTSQITPTQLLAWISNASYHARLTIGIAALAPKLRLANILNLTWPDVDLQRKIITVRKHKTDASGVPLIAPITEQLFAILKDAYERRSPLVKSPHVVLYRSAPIKTIDSSVRKAAETAGLIWGRDIPGGVTFHTLRHSMSTLLARLGVHPLIHQELMGHEDAATTRGYTHLEPDDQRPAAEQLSATVNISSAIIEGPTRVNRRQERISAPERTPERLRSRPRGKKGQQRATSGLRKGPRKSP